MPLTSGTRLGPYEIVAPLGAGGMGEVYKARDTRLDRLVAIKILPEQFAADPGREERFQREARAVAALSHAHICALHDVGDAPNPQSQIPNPAPVRFLVMEYLEGQTLAERLLRGPLSTAELMRCAIEIADALDHAHRRGLVHRDLKPGNVMLTKAGAKLLDFGLSKLQSRPDLIALSTVSPGVPLTAEGAVLGTFPYMAPEQLAGREADARSDIFAFGAMVYEMATGRRAFEGSTSATVIGAVLHTDPPPLSTLQPLAPPGLDRLVSRCLAKDPDDRWQTARDLTLELKWIAEHAAPIEVERARDKNRKIGLIATVALAGIAIAAAAFTVSYVRRPPADDATVRLSFSPPEGLTLADVAIGGLAKISPDGQRLAFVAMGPDSKQLLWVRPLDSLVAQVLPGTDGAENPFWSPDGQSIGFFAQRKLRKIQVSGGAVQTLGDAVQPRGGTWNRDGVIVFSANSGHQLYRVLAGGGVVTPIPADGMNEERYWPLFLPDGHHFIYRGRPQQHGIFVAALASAGATLLLDASYLSAAYSPSGYLLGLLGSSLGAPSGTLLARRFDPAHFQVVGDPVPVAEQVAYRNSVARAAFSISENGTLVYGSVESLAARLIWFDRSGNELRSVSGSVTYNSPALSPDERTIAVERFGPEGQSDLWLIDTTRDVPSRFTSSTNYDGLPVWSPDGARIVFSSPRGTPPSLYLKELSGAPGEELLVKTKFNKVPTDWSRDGRFIVYMTLDPNTQWDLWILPMSGPQAGRKPVPFLQTAYNEALGQFSPDGRWLAYVSDESGANEVYVQKFPEPGARQRISAKGGNSPRWRGDGRELFYLAADGTLMAVSVMPGAGFEASAPVALFKTRTPGVGAVNNWGYNPNYTVTRDGRRFLINTVAEEHSVPTTIVLNWPAALRIQN